MLRDAVTTGAVVVVVLVVDVVLVDVVLVEVVGDVVVVVEEPAVVVVDEPVVVVVVEEPGTVVVVVPPGTVVVVDVGPAVVVVVLATVEVVGGTVVLTVVVLFDGALSDPQLHRKASAHAHAMWPNNRLPLAARPRPFSTRSIKHSDYFGRHVLALHGEWIVLRPRLQVQSPRPFEPGLVVLHQADGGGAARLIEHVARRPHVVRDPGERVERSLVVAPVERRQPLAFVDASFV